MPFQFQTAVGDMASAYHMVHYRKLSCNVFADSKQCTEDLARIALDKHDANKVKLCERIQDRILDVPGETGRQLILNKVADLTDAVFGEMILAQKGGFQAFVQMAGKKEQLSNITLAEIYQLQEHEAPRGSTFIRGIFYWMIIKNHLFFVKTQSATVPMFQDYLNWFLAHPGGALPAGEIIKLQAEFDKSTVSGDIGDIQNLRLIGRSEMGVPIAARTAAQTKEIATSRKVADRFVEFSQALPIVKILFGAKRTESLVDSLGPDEYLAVDASVKVRGRRTAESKERLRNIASELADFTDAELRVEGKDGNLKDGDAILRTRMAFNLPYEASNILDFDNVADQLQEVYSRFVHDGKIPAG